MTYGIDLELHENVAEVGGRVSGEVRRPAQPADSSDPVRALRLTLYCKTSGRGDEDEFIASKVELPAADDGAFYNRFELVVPSAGPISYDGRLIRVSWAVEARLDVKLKRDLKVHKPVLVVPLGGVAVYDRPHPLQ